MVESKTLPISLKAARVFCYIHIVLSCVLIAVMILALDTSLSSHGFFFGIKSAIYKLAQNKFNQPVYTPEAAGNLVGIILLPLLVAWAALWNIRSPTTRKSYIVLLLLIAVGMMGSVALLIAGICFLLPKARHHLKIFQSSFSRG